MQGRSAQRRGGLFLGSVLEILMGGVAQRSQKIIISCIGVIWSESSSPAVLGRGGLGGCPGQESPFPPPLMHMHTHLSHVLPAPPSPS